MPSGHGRGGRKDRRPHSYASGHLVHLLAGRAGPRDHLATHSVVVQEGNHRPERAQMGLRTHSISGGEAYFPVWTPQRTAGSCCGWLASLGAERRGRCARPGLSPHPSRGKLAQDESLGRVFPQARPEAGHVGASSLPKFPLSSKQQSLPPGLATSFWSPGSPRGRPASGTPVLDTGEVCRLGKAAPDHRTLTRRN